MSDLDTSLGFYVGVVGFAVVFERRAERFAYLDLEGASVMLQEAAGPGRRFRTALLERPFGRGINLQVAVADVDALHDRLVAAGVDPLVPLEERWYEVDVLHPAPGWPRQGSTRVGNRQLVVADPDGYLWRFFTDLGSGPAAVTR